MKESLLVDLFYFFAATALFVPIFKSLGLGSTLGYLISGCILGPSALGLLQQSHSIEQISEIGIILLLFIIGLELSPARLKALRKSIFTDGTLQFIFTILITGGVAFYFTKSVSISFLVGVTLALSSTAITLYYLKDSQQLTKSFGQTSFSILLFQDLVIIPILTVIPFINSTKGFDQIFTSYFIFEKIIIISCIILFARYVLLRALTWVSKSQGIEIFVATCLLAILGTSLAIEALGLSKALGAFMIGIFLSDSLIKSEIHKVTIPIKSMLMGVFFIGVGLSLDLNYISSNIVKVVSVTALFMSAKFIVLFALGYYRHRNWKTASILGLLLCQGGEFGLLVLTTSKDSGLFTSNLVELISTCIILSLFISPFLAKLSTLLINKSSESLPIGLTLVSQNEEEEIRIEKIAA